MSKYTVIVKQDGDSWIGWIEKVPGVNCHESSRDALLAPCGSPLQEALEFNRADARSGAADHSEEVRIAA
jgi:hypothetical protein